MKQNDLNSAFSIYETILSTSIFITLFLSIVFSYISLIKMEIKKNEKLYSSIKIVDEISKKYYFEQDE